MHLSPSLKKTSIPAFVIGIITFIEAISNNISGFLLSQE
jgi:hypothetical protein